MIETWVPSPVFGDIYAVSDCGHVKNINSGLLKILTPDQDGYLSVMLYCGKASKNCRVHRLVMGAFVGLSDNEVNHKNGIKTDNRLRNLEYVTRFQNEQHAWQTGLKKLNTTGPVCPVVQLDKLGQVIASFPSQAEASRKTGVNSQLISACIKGMQKTAGGFGWRRTCDM